jgi:hypothetical protein
VRDGPGTPAELRKGEEDGYDRRAARRGRKARLERCGMDASRAFAARMGCHWPAPKDGRPTLKAFLWLAWTGASWRELPER